MRGLLVVAVVLAVATVFGVWFGRVSGRIKDSAPRPAPLGVVPAADDDPPVDIEPAAPDIRMQSLVSALAGRLGTKVTVVQFSSAFCQPCRATRRILEEVTAMVPGVAHVEIDAEDNLDLVRALDIRRTPTVLFLDSAGVVRKQASGLPRKADVIAAIGELVPDSGGSDFTI
jgi:thiol-disulfide isomerase/thioredoxin